MHFSLSGLVYIILMFALGLLTYRFFQYWRDKQDSTSKLFFLFSFSYTIMTAIRGFFALFFLYNKDILLYSISLVAFMEAVGAAVVAYLVFFVKFPKISPWVGFFAMLLYGLSMVYLTTQVPYDVTIGEFGSIDWNYHLDGFTITFSILRALLLFLTFIPFMAIIVEQASNAKDIVVKKRSIGLSFILLVAAIIGVVDFIIVSLLRLSIFYRDVVLIFLGVFVFFLVVFTQKRGVEYRSKV